MAHWESEENRSREEMKRALADLFGRKARHSRERPPGLWLVPGGPEVALFVGELAEAPADVLCTSTNPKLSLLGGTGAAVIESAGWGVREEARGIVQAAQARTGRAGLEIGTVHRTSAGRLSHAFLLHCVASGPGHAVSGEAIRSCVRGAVAETDRAGRSSVAMPVFGAGHASFPFDRAVRAIAEELSSVATAVKRVVLVVLEPERVTMAERVLDSVLPGSRSPGRS
jgi:O-acetyl-ADP-ribose deacetylase (regulator of RNase III)